MSTKRTPMSRQHHSQGELRRWSAYLSYGADYFKDLERLGLSPEEIQSQATTIWRRHGLRFMAGWRADGESGLPWAAREFGEPR